MPSDDPTRSATKRRRWTGKFNSRYESIVGNINEEFRGGSDFRPRNDVSEAVQTSDFREWFEEQLADEVVEPMTGRQVRNGAHYTADYVDEFYQSGIRLANSDLRSSGIDLPDASPDAIASRDLHEEKRQSEYVEVYQELEDVALETEKQASREYRDAVAGGAALALTLGALKDRVRKVGESRTKNLTHSYGTRIINDAVVERAYEVGVEELGVEVEIDLEVEDYDVQHWEAILDESTCAQCRALHGNSYPVEDIRSGDAPMPVRDTHAYCRCRYVIVL